MATSLIHFRQTPLGSWQSKCWVPEFNDPTFDSFCDALGKPFGRFTAAELESAPFGDERRLVAIDQDFAVDFTIVNYGRWIKKVA
jgi:hypothetical protein